MFQRFIVALGCSSVLSACTETAVSPTAVPASPTPIAAAPKSAVGNKLPGFGVAFLPVNENRCEERTAVTDASGKIVAWTRTPSEVTPRFAGPTSEVSAYSILTFSARSHQQTSQFDCVLQSGSEALPFMKAQLATRHAPAAVRTLGGTIGYSLGGDSGTCEWDGWGLTCEGDACVRGYAAMRATGARSTAPVPGPAARIEMGALGAWHCGSCNVFISESGSVFNCGDDDPPEGGGGGGGGCVGGGGGGGGGGGLLVASCEPSVPDLPNWANDELVEAWPTMNLAEKNMCVTHMLVCLGWAIASKEAINFANDIGQNDDEVQALRHTLWSSLLTVRLGGTDRAFEWTEAHEIGSIGSDPSDTCRDRTNNTTGRSIGTTYLPRQHDINQAQLVYDIKQTVLGMHSQHSLQYVPSC